MSISHDYRTVLTSGADSIDKTVTQTVDAEDRRSLSITNSASYQQVDVAFVRSRLKTFMLVSDKALTVKTNANNNTADDTITITANQPLAWNALSGVTVPFAADVTTLYILNSSGNTAAVEIIVGKDSTP